MGVRSNLFHFLLSDFIQLTIITPLHMASSTEETKVLCVVCNKAKGIYKCEGCSRIFCPKHSIDHRNELNVQLEEVAVTHDLVQQTLIQQEQDPQQHPLLKKINQWEKKSIDIIRQTAEKARNELLKGATRYTTEVKQKLQILSNELRQGREDNDFSEIDLRKWTQKLEELKTELLNPVNITIREDSTPLITNIGIDCQDATDVFERVCSNAQIKENGRLAVGTGEHTEIRGKREYNTGRYTLRFGVEQLVQNGWIMFGIISKSESMKNTSYTSPSTYAWSNRNQIYANGLYKGEDTLEITQNDIIILTLDCDQRKIELKNKRMNRGIELSVDINKCPFPWQLHLNLLVANTRVRILNPSD
jgi:hypothetical protein